MKKAFWFIITFILINSILFSGCERNKNDVNSKDRMVDSLENDSYDKNTDEPLPTTISPDAPDKDSQKDVPDQQMANRGNIKVLGDAVNIRKDKTTSSEVIAQVQKNDVFSIVDKGVDSDNKTWYLIEYSFGAKGWIAGWLCEKTEERARVYKSEKGQILDPAIDKDLYLRALLLGEYTLESFEEVFGHDYVKSRYGEGTRYDYSNGLFFQINAENELMRFGFCEEYKYITPRTITRKTCNILSNPGDELLIFFEYNLYYRLLICDADTKDILREYNLDYLNLSNYEVGDFMNDGNLQLYLDGHGDGILKKGIYRVVDDDFVEVFNINSFSQYKDNIIARLNGNNFLLTVQLDGYNKNLTSVLPNKVFYETQDVQDKNGLLFVESSWSINKKNGKWCIFLRYSVNYPIIYYYWGPPGEDVEPNSMLANDLARVDLTLLLKGGVPEITDAYAQMKYNNPDLLSTEQLGYDEIRLIDGPAVEMSMEEAYKALGGDMEGFKYADYIEYNGVSLFEFCSSIVEITVNTPKYETPRSLKVGDTIEKVESLYGKPDAGFSGDDHVMYKCTGEDYINYYRGLDIRYKNGVVESFTLYQVILD